MLAATRRQPAIAKKSSKMRNKQRYHRSYDACFLLLKVENLRRIELVLQAVILWLLGSM